MLQGLRVHMTAREAIRLTIKKDEQGKEIVGDMKMVMNNEAEIIKGNFHPLVRTHPETGKKSSLCRPALRPRHHGYERRRSQAATQLLG
jgi:alpha-ketoglutarate-dependent taurine dioxygenase